MSKKSYPGQDFLDIQKCYWYFTFVKRETERKEKSERVHREENQTRETGKCVDKL